MNLAYLSIGSREIVLRSNTIKMNGNRILPRLDLHDYTFGSNHWRGFYTYLYDRRWGRKKGGVFGKVANPESGRHDEKLERTTTLGEREKC